MERKTLSRILFVNACFSLSRTGACKQLSARTIRHSDQDVHEVSRSWARRRVFLHVSGAPRLKKEKSGGLFFCFSLALALSLSSLSSLVARVSPSIAFSLSDKPRNAGLSFLAELSLPSAVERSTRPLCQVRGELSRPHHAIKVTVLHKFSLSTPELTVNSHTIISFVDNPEFNDPPVI